MCGKEYLRGSSSCPNSPNMSPGLTVLHRFPSRVHIREIHQRPSNGTQMRDLRREAPRQHHQLRRGPAQKAPQLRLRKREKGRFIPLRRLSRSNRGPLSRTLPPRTPKRRHRLRFAVCNSPLFVDVPSSSMSTPLLPPGAWALESTIHTPPVLINIS